MTGQGVYPRVGGATNWRRTWTAGGRGLSPRGRGNPWPSHNRIPLRGSIPAWAGQPSPLPTFRAIDRVYPRVGGATIAWTARSCVSTGLSPRGRGNRHHDRVDVALHGSIPAWAGQPADSPRSASRSTVYPRVGGATDRCDGQRGKRRGLSPRGRGNPLKWRAVSFYDGSIPAWAGQPGEDWWLVNDNAVYPRVGGATLRRQAQRKLARGLSPRGRGNRLCNGSSTARSGPIPAWAGQPSSPVALA